MKKIWITRKEIRQLVKEEFPGGNWADQIPDDAEEKMAKQRPRLPAFPKHPQSISLEPEQRPQASVPPSPPAQSPQKKRPTVGQVKGRDQRSHLKPSGLRDPSAKQPYTRQELRQGADIKTGAEEPDVLPAGKPPKVSVVRGKQGRSRVVPTGRRDSTAKQPYTRDELRQGADIDQPAQPGVLDRLKKIFLGKRG